MRGDFNAFRPVKRKGAFFELIKKKEIAPYVEGM
jgi:hypothetical protein